MSFSKTLNSYLQSSAPESCFPLGINKAVFAWKILVVFYGKIWWLHAVLPTGNYAGQSKLLKQTGNTRLSSRGTERRETLLVCGGGRVYAQPPLPGRLSAALHSRVSCSVCVHIFIQAQLLHTMCTPSVCDRFYEIKGENREGWTWLRKHQSGSIGAPFCLSYRGGEAEQGDKGGGEDGARTDPRRREMLPLCIFFYPLPISPSLAGVFCQSGLTLTD